MFVGDDYISDEIIYENSLEEEYSYYKDIIENNKRNEQNLDWLYEENDEEWRDIEGFEGLYRVSNTGKIKALERLVENNGGMQHKHERILKENYGSRGLVVLCKDGKTYPMLSHRIVAKAFIPNPENKPEVDHIDTNFHNNNANNLKWVTHKENSNNELTKMHISQSKMGHEYWGRPLTDEEKMKISIAHKGMKFSEEHKKKLSESHKGIMPPKSAVENARKANLGKHRSEETKEKIRQSRIRSNIIKKGGEYNDNI